MRFEVIYCNNFEGDVLMDVLVMVDATTMGLVNVNICGVDKIVLFLYVKMTVFKMGIIFIIL
jgi:hypothetical protein